jgi:hypothetical protein
MELEEQNIDDDSSRSGLEESAAAPPPRFSALDTFVVESVGIFTVDLQGYALATSGSTPAAERLGAPCGDPDCDYALVELALAPALGRLTELMLFGTAARWSIDMVEYLKGLRRDVFGVHALEPIVVADLRTHGIHWRLPLTPESLRRTGNPDTARDAAGWELVRVLRDALPVIDAIAVPTSSRHVSYELLFFHQRLHRLRFEHLGRLEDTVPLHHRRA